MQSNNATIIETEIIKWAEEARKVIVFLSDQSVHYAYDGLLGGIVTPAGNAKEYHNMKSSLF